MTAAAIPDGLRPKLGRLMRLLASDQPGEVVAAAAALKRALAGCGADLNDLGDAIEHPDRRVVVVEREGPARPRRGHRARAGDVVLDARRRAAAAVALHYALGGARLSAWEREFAHSILGRLQMGCGRLTERQGQTLARLLDKIGEGSAWV